METSPRAPAESEWKPLVLALLSILGVICLLSIAAAVGGAYLLKYDKTRQEDVAATTQAHATSTAEGRSTQVAQFEFFDDFSDNHNQWYAGAGDDLDGWDGSISVQEGKYIWSVTEVHGEEAFTWREYEHNKEPLQDFDLSVDVKTASGTICPGVAFRVRFKGAYTATYVFMLCNDQQFSVSYFNSDEGWDTITTWTPSTAINPEGWNNLSVSARQNHFVLSINNVVLSEFDDDRLPRGRIFLVMQNYDLAPGAIWFDNFGLQPY